MFFLLYLQSINNREWLLGADPAANTRRRTSMLRGGQRPSSQENSYKSSFQSNIHSQNPFWRSRWAICHICTRIHMILRGRRIANLKIINPLINMLVGISENKSLNVNDYIVIKSNVSCLYLFDVLCACSVRRLLTFWIEIISWTLLFKSQEWSRCTEGCIQYKRKLI